MNCFKKKKNNQKVNIEGNSENYLNLKKKQINEINYINDAIKSLKYQKIILLKDIKTLNEKKKTDESNLCNICLVPCGHLVCNVCMKDNQQCYFCRKDIKIKQKIYFN